MRIIPKGLELDIKSIISSKGENVWENITTYFYPGKFGPADASYSSPRLDLINDAPVINKWYLPAKNRFRFARISGDTNGIHYVSFYARVMGFKRDFAQPIRVVAKCVSSLPIAHGIKSWLEELNDSCIISRPRTPAALPKELDFYLKGPVYYDNTLILKNIKTEKGNRFDLYCNDESKPAISGMLYL